MPRKTMEQVQEAILRALAGSQPREQAEAQIKAHVVKFDQPYIYDGKKADIKGQTFESVDLSGVGDLCTMHEITAKTGWRRKAFRP